LILSTCTAQLCRKLNSVYFIELHVAADIRLHCSPQLAFNPLNAELNTICHLVALLGAHHIFHVSRIRVKYILRNVSTDLNTYIYTHIKGTVISIDVSCFLPDNGRMERWKHVVGRSINESTVFKC